MKVYLKIFLITGIPYVILMVAYDVFHGVQVELVFALLSGLVFGLFMSLIYGTLQILSTRKIVTGGDVSPRQTETVYLDISLDAAFDRCREAFSEIGAKTKFEDREQGRIEAKTNINWKSFGEVILIQLCEQTTGQVSVQISSSPKLKMTLVDYGKGYENVKHITGFLTVPDLVQPNAGK